MFNLIEPNIHPILVHFAYALSVTAAACYVLVRVPAAERWHGTLRPAADWMLAFGSAAILLTILAGFQAYYSVAHDGPSHAAMTVHRNWAVSSGTAILLLAAWRWRSRTAPASLAFTGVLMAAALALTATAWWGGKIVYGYGLGVQSLPQVTGDGHDHDHGASDAGAAEGGHDHAAMNMDDDMDMMGDMGMPGMDAHGEAGHHDGDEGRAEPLAQSGSGTASEAADRFATALRSGNTATVRAMLDPEVLVAEGGNAERSFDDYAGHHMPADMAFLAATEQALTERTVIESPAMATVISTTRIHGMHKGKAVDLSSIETMVLERKGEDWKIVHLHWSSAPIAGDHEH
jgi:uncharacterized membrane protein